VKIGPYEVEDELARGGMGVVFRARDPRLERTVVLKLLQVDSERARRRLQREADAMARLQHPHLVPVHDVGEHAGQPYLVLPLIPGDSLRDRLNREGPQPVGQVCEWVAQVGEGLAVAHAAGLIHRDVKPANVLLDEEGRALLTDFGLVKQVGPEKAETVSLSVQGQFLGTPGFWPREQAFGQKHAIGPPADVYGLAALLYALLTGVPPRQPGSMATLYSDFDQPVAPASSLRPEVPRWLDRLLAECLADAPQARPRLSLLIDSLRARAYAPDRLALRQRALLAAVALATVTSVVLAAAVWVRSRAASSTPAPASLVVSPEVLAELGLLDAAWCAWAELTPRDAAWRERGERLLVAGAVPARLDGLGLDPDTRRLWTAYLAHRERQAAAEPVTADPDLRALAEAVWDLRLRTALRAQSCASALEALRAGIAGTRHAPLREALLGELREELTAHYLELRDREGEVVARLAGELPTLAADLWPLAQALEPKLHGTHEEAVAALDRILLALPEVGVRLRCTCLRLLFERCQHWVNGAGGDPGPSRALPFTRALIDDLLDRLRGLLPLLDEQPWLARRQLWAAAGARQAERLYPRSQPEVWPDFEPARAFFRRAEADPLALAELSLTAGEPHSAAFLLRLVGTGQGLQSRDRIQFVNGLLELEWARGASDSAARSRHLDRAEGWLEQCAPARRQLRTYWAARLHAATLRGGIPRLDYSDALNGWRAARPDAQAPYGYRLFDPAKHYFGTHPRLPPPPFPPAPTRPPPR